MKKPEGRLYASILGALSAALVAMGFALNVLTVSAVIGPFHFFQRGAHTSRVGLWIPPSAHETSSESRTRQLRAWRAAVVHEHDARVSDSLRDLRENGIDVVAVVEGRQLTAEEALHLLGFVRAGGGVLVTGLLGVRDVEGGWRGDAVMRRLLRSQAVTLRPQRSPAHLVPGRRGALVAGVEPGRRIAVRTDAGAPALALGSGELAWEADAADPDLPSGASLRLEVGDGRLAWLAAGPEAAVAEHSSELLSGGDLTRVIESALAWLSHEPTHEVLPWPNAAPAVGLRATAGSPDDASRRAVLTDEVRRSVEEQVEGVVQIGGVLHFAAVAAAHPETSSAALQRFAEDRLRAHGSWIAVPGEFAQWRRMRRELDVSLGRVGPQRLLLEVSSRSRKAVPGVVVRVHLNGPTSQVDVGRTTLQQARPVSGFDLGAQYVDIWIPDLAKRSQAFTIDLTPMGSGADT